MLCNEIIIIIIIIIIKTVKYIIIYIYIYIYYFLIITRKYIIIIIIIIIIVIIIVGSLDIQSMLQGRLQARPSLGNIDSNKLDSLVSRHQCSHDLHNWSIYR